MTDKDKRMNEIRKFAEIKKASVTSTSGEVTPAKKPTTKIPPDLNATSGKSKKQLRLENEAKREAEGNPQKKADEELDAAVKPKKAAKDPNMLSVSQVATELGLDPKRARAKLRAAGQSATEGRWSLVKRDSKEHKALIALLSLKAKATSDDADDDEDEDEE